jgi:poly(hydroxyalkanoate) granule-associated protein
MTETTESTPEPIEKTPNEGERGRFTELARKVMFAGIGAAVLAQEEIEAFVKKLVERGELAEKDGEGLLAEMHARRRERMSKVEEEVNKHVGRALERLNIPSKDEIAALNEKIAALNAKLDEMKKGE